MQPADVKAPPPLSSTGLIRAVGMWGLVAMCVNAVVGSGVYLLPSETFNLLGRFSLWAPLLFAIPVFILALCFAEAASHFTEPGGAYLYTRTAFGDFIGFETGWMNTIARVTSLAALANGFVVSLARLIPEAGEGAARTVLIILPLLVFGIIHAMGIRYGAGTIYAFTWGKILPLIVFIIVALIAFRHNPLPGSFSVPTGNVEWGDAALFLLFAYAGFENLGIPAGEYKNPRRDLPFALLIGILAIAAVYSLAQLAAMASLQDLGATGTPIADAAAAIMGPAGATLITVGAIISILGTNLGTTLEGSRMIFALGRDRKPFRLLGYVHPGTHTPVLAIAALLAVAIPVAVAGSFATLALLSAGARLTTYLFTAAAVPRLRKLNPGFVSPGGLTVPILGVLIAAYFFFGLRTEQLIALGIAILVGAILYGLSMLAGGRVVEETPEVRED
ncbi:MAG TPA: APC family permease [Thermoanaerobaculia bacterium]|nr:APC family permease [Thermoanaerobaculia bacterium]